MDKGTLIGLVLGFVAIFGASVLESGNPGSLVAMLNPPAALIVFGGTFGAAITSFPLQRLKRFPTFLRVAFRDTPASGAELVEMFVRLAERARREGLLALEGDANEIEDDLIRKGVLLVVDGTDPELVREIMEADVAATAERHEANYAVLEAMGGFAPTMGIIGTVIGLVNVLSNIENPEELSRSIATAFIATLYGVFTANILWLPLGQRLKHRNKEEVARRNLAVEGVLAVQAGDNPRVVREKLEAFLSPGERRDPEAAAAAPATARGTSGSPTAQAA